MSDDIRHQFINWKTGMQVSVNHFLDLENAILDRLNDSRALRTTNYNYGLIPSFHDDYSSPPLTITVENTSSRIIKISLRHCRAITRSGSRIEINDKIFGEEFFSKEISTESLGGPAEYLIAIGIQPFKRTEIGRPDPNESFERYPYTIPTYELRVFGSKEILTSDSPTNYLPLCRLKYDGHTIVEDVNYIPPCMSIKASPALKKVFEELEAIVSKAIFKKAAKVIQIVNHQRANPDKRLSKKQREENYELAGSFAGFCRDINAFLSSNIGSLKLKAAQSPPIDTISFFMGLAYATQVFFDTLTEAEKQKMFEYIEKLINKGQGEIEKATSAMMNNKYDHLDVQASFQVAHTFVKILQLLLTTLSEQEYIGKKVQDPELFVDVQDTEEELKKRHRDNSSSFQFVED